MKKRKFFNVQVEKSVGKVFLYGNIGDGEKVEADRVAAELEALERSTDKIKVHINSNGGDVFSGIAIYNALKNSKAKVSIYIDGVAASIAGVIALCGKPLYMSKHAKLMLHNVSGSVSGNAAEMRETANLIEMLEAELAEMISAKCKMQTAEIVGKYFDGQDHWLSAKDCQSLGLLAGIYDISDEDRKEIERKTNKFQNLKAQKHQGEEISTQIRTYIDLGMINKEQETLFVSLAKSDPEEFEKYINKKKVLLRKEVSDEIAAAIKTQRIRRDKAAFYNDLGLKVGVCRLKEILADIAPFTRVDCYIDDKPQPNWTLADYRKRNPLYLLDHPDFYARLKREYKNEAPALNTLDYYRRNHPELLERNKDFYKTLVENNKN